MAETDLKYWLEHALVKKLDLIIDRCEKKTPVRDAVLIIEGGEGEGKTNTSLALAYYIKYRTGREIHLFFRLYELIEFAKNHKKMIIIWDEPALDSLSTDWYKTTNRNLIRLLMAVRKNQHIFLFNFTKFYKFSEYIVVDRSIGLIHMYSRNETTPGRFVYIKRRRLEELYTTYRSKKKRIYKSLTSFRGNMAEVVERYYDRMGIFLNNIPNSTKKMYDDEKDKAISNIGEEDKTLKEEKTVEKEQKLKDKKELRELKSKIGKLKYPIKNRREIARSLGLNKRTIERWAEIPENEENDTRQNLIY